MKDIFFVTGCARSGTTSLCRILDSASNSVCMLEPDPKFNKESRDMIDGHFETPELIIKTIRTRIVESHAKGLIHGEKNLTLIPFIPLLESNFRCKFIFVHRDGRKTVRSLLEWHNRLFGNIYRECSDIGECSETALKNAASLPIHLDTADYSRPRPNKNNPFYGNWMKLSRMEMCAWYWSEINMLAVTNLSKIPKDKWMAIDYSSPNTESIKGIIDFLGLEGISSDRIQNMLDSNINSIQNRTGEKRSYPVWDEWDEEEKDKFNYIANKTMKLLGYY